MKKFFKTLFPVFFALVLTSPSGAFANEFQDFEETLENQNTSSDYGGYTLAFLDANLDLTLNRSDLSDQAGALMIFITDTDGKLLKEAQVIATMIGSEGEQRMVRAQPFKGAFLIDTEALTPGQYNLEAEIITNGCLLTEEFSFRHV